MTNSLSYFMGCICKKYRGIVLAPLFIRALLVLMRVAVLESVSQVLAAVVSYGD